VDDDAIRDATPRDGAGATPLGRWLRTTSVGCLVTPAVLLLLVVGGLVWWRQAALQAAAEAERAQAAKADETFGPALDKLSPEPLPEVEAVDIDKTIRVIHEIDLALRSYDDFESYLEHVGRQDYRRVAPEVLEARRDLLDKVRELYAKQTEFDQQQALWDFTKGMMLETLSVVEAEGEWGTLGPTGSFSVDRDHARELLAEFREEQRSQERRIRELGAARDELFEAMLQYSEVYYGFIEQWDRLCVLRDRAYLAAVEEDWETVEAASRQAIERSPHEREAHLLLARSLVARDDPEAWGEAADLLEAQIDAHPGQSAPAFLLMGVLARQQGDLAQSRLYLQQAAAYYPKQAEGLTDMLDPYRMRTFLRKSRDGTVILEAYQDTMRGAGWYSPELQLARTAFDEGDRETGRQRVLDHFSRRRAQQQWGFVLSDLAYIHDLLGADARRIFPEDAWVDLVVSRPMWGEGLNVAVRNRTDETLRNATLILLVQFTDMHPGDYVTLAAETQPAVPGHETTDFGTLPVKTTILGRERTVDDIVRHRAILLTDEAVSWVDTDEYKVAELEKVEKARRREGAPPEAGKSWYREMETRLEDVAGELPASTTVEIEPTLGRDSVVFQLPRELAILRPVFRLSYGGQTWTARENRIDDEHITLRFDAVEDFTREDAGDLELGIRTIFGEVALTYGPDGEMSYGFRRITQ
jgi:tetratricopeptide (TPR) repeat protein